MRATKYLLLLLALIWVQPPEVSSASPAQVQCDDTVVYNGQTLPFWGAYYTEASSDLLCYYVQQKSAGQTAPLGLGYQTTILLPAPTPLCHYIRSFTEAWGLRGGDAAAGMYYYFCVSPMASACALKLSDPCCSVTCPSGSSCSNGICQISTTTQAPSSQPVTTTPTP